MRTRIVAGTGAAVTAVALAALLVAVSGERAPPPREAAAAPASKPAAEARLYCEFYNFAGRTPKVGFYFAAPAKGSDYAQIFQREADGAQTIFEPRPTWIYDRTGEQPTLNSPDGAIRINLYGDAAGAASAASGGWFEAGLRSIQYLNLEGQCRRNAT